MRKDDNYIYVKKGFVLAITADEVLACLNDERINMHSLPDFALRMIANGEIRRDPTNSNGLIVATEGDVSRATHGTVITKCCDEKPILFDASDFEQQFNKHEPPQPAKDCNRAERECLPPPTAANHPDPLVGFFQRLVGMAKRWDRESKLCAEASTDTSVPSSDRLKYADRVGIARFFSAELWCALRDIAVHSKEASLVLSSENACMNAALGLGQQNKTTPVPPPYDALKNAIPMSEIESAVLKQKDMEKEWKRCKGAQ